MASRTGVVVSYASLDAVGRIRLDDDGAEVRFGASTLREGLVPFAGARVRVEGLGPHPLGGQRASSVFPASDDGSSRESAAAFLDVFAAEAASIHARSDAARAEAAKRVRPEPPTPAEVAELARLATRRAEHDRAREEERQRLEVLARDVKSIVGQVDGIEGWKRVLSRAGVPDAVARRMLAAARPASLLVAGQHLGPRGSVASRLGGEPALAVQREWPRLEERPLPFLAQVRLSSLVASTKQSLGLPREGLLSFFVDVAGLWDHDPARAVVLFEADVDALERRAAPGELSADLRFAAVEVECVEELRLADRRASDLDAAWVDEDHDRPDWEDALIDAIAAWDEAHPSKAHWVGGHASTIHDDMRERCAVIRAGLDSLSLVDDWDPGVVAARADAGRWRLLLQLDSDDAFGVMWGDNGKLYLWIHEDDLAALRFDDIVCLVQCH